MSKVYSAITISPGLALGRLQLCQPQLAFLRGSSRDPIRQQALFQLLDDECQALEQLRQHPQLTECQRQLLDADLLLLSDPDLRVELEQQLLRDLSPAQACQAVFDALASQMADLKEPGLAHRGRDLRALGLRLSQRLEGQRHKLPDTLSEPTILVVPDLTAAEFIRLPKANLVGVVLELGSGEDHLAILLRSAGIPTLVMEQALSRLGEAPALLDGDTGQLTLGTKASDLEIFKATLGQWEARRQAELAGLAEEAITADGERVVLGANIGSLDEATHPGHFHLDEVGLLRTEFLYLDQAQWPSQDDQLAMYRAIARRLDGRPLTIRSFDFGADKPLPGLHLDDENPALGQRAIRLALAQPEALRAQLGAIVQLATEHPVRLLVPMVSLVEEMEQLLAHLNSVKAALNLAPTLPVGIMVETPASVLMLDALAPLVDFASIGSNDLAQYCYAADRHNPRISPFYPQLSPALIRLLMMACQQAQSLDLPLSLCGELGSDPRAMPLLLAMGLRRFSITANRSAEIKYVIRQYRHETGHSLLQQALSCTSKRQLIALLNDCVEK